MKKILLIGVMVLGIMTSCLADDYVINRAKKDISKPQTERTIKKDEVPPYNTGWTFQGQPVYISKGGQGSAYVIKYKKADGTPYKQYLGKELTEQYKKLCGLK